MPMPPPLRRAGLVVHVVSSVGWLGAVAAFLLLAVAALRSTSAATVEALYVGMDLLLTVGLVPLALASLGTGLVQSLGTPWGLLRHYWVLLKLAITALSTLVLLAYVPTMRTFGDAARGQDPQGLLPSTSPVLHASAAVLVLLLAAVLSVYKPRGVTPYGWRKTRRRSAA
jgi:hypothetical protein